MSRYDLINEAYTKLNLKDDFNSKRYLTLLHVRFQVKYSYFVPCKIYGFQSYLFNFT